MHSMLLALAVAALAATTNAAPYTPPPDLPEQLRRPETAGLDLHLYNVLPPLLDEDDPRSKRTWRQAEPVADTPFVEHVRRILTPGEREAARRLLEIGRAHV